MIVMYSRPSAVKPPRPLKHWSSGRRRGASIDGFVMAGRRDGTAVVTSERSAPTTCLPHVPRSEEHTSELQSRLHLVCRLLLLKKKKKRLVRLQLTKRAHR